MFTVGEHKHKLCQFRSLLALSKVLCETKSAAEFVLYKGVLKLK